jgi:hypothetical protein
VDYSLIALAMNNRHQFQIRMYFHEWPLAIAPDSTSFNDSNILLSVKIILNPTASDELQPCDAPSDVFREENTSAPLLERS